MTRYQSAQADAQPRPQILFVEDDEALARAVGDRWLSRRGFSVTFAHTLADAKREFEAEASSFDALVFDLDLPDGDSRTLIPEVAKVCPVVVLTGSQEPGFRYECMDLGATHVVGKCEPGGDSLRYLEACLRSAIKNGVQVEGEVEVEAGGSIRVGSTLIKPDGDVVRKGEPLGTLTERELALLRCLAGKRGEFVSGEEIMAEVWDKTSVIRANLPQQVSTLRTKLGPDGIAVVGRRGRGYRLRQVGD